MRRVEGGEDGDPLGNKIHEDRHRKIDSNRSNAASHRHCDCSSIRMLNNSQFGCLSRALARLRPTDPTVQDGPEDRNKKKLNECAKEKDPSSALIVLDIRNNSVTVKKKDLLNSPPSAISPINLKTIESSEDPRPA